MSRCVDIAVNEDEEMIGIGRQEDTAAEKTTLRRSCSVPGWKNKDSGTLTSLLIINTWACIRSRRVTDSKDNYLEQMNAIRFCPNALRVKIYDTFRAGDVPYGVIDGTFSVKTVKTFYVEGLLVIAAMRPNRKIAISVLQISNSWDPTQFLQDYERNATEMCYRVTSATWSFSTNVTEYNRKRMLEEQELAIKMGKEWWRRAAQLSGAQADVPTKRQLRILLTEGRFALDDERFRELYGVIARMKDTFALTRVCPAEHRRVSVPCPWRLEPELVRIMGGRWEPDILKSAWVAWHDAVGPPIRPYFVRYVQLANEAARLAGFPDAGAHMRAPYGGGGGNPSDPSFNTASVDGPPLEPSDIASLWSQVAPLYRQLHAFVRRGLIKHYGSSIIQEGGPIPAHLLGNMWAQSWKNIADLVAPFPSKTAADVTPEMLRQGYTPLRIFQTAEEFYTSMGLPGMPSSFWQHSMLQRPQDREVVCRASAWDFCNRHDYRIKHCTEVTMDDLLTAHHEMAHVQYYLHYQKQPLLFRRGANPGFHEAIGDAIGLSASTPRHLQRIGLLNNITDDYETNINFLMTVALDKVVYLAFAYVVEQWRWRVFSEGTDSMNERWWRLRWLHHGISPPVPRTEEHLDAVAKYHLAADAPYVRYFVALILQFQIHEALCSAAGHRGPLHTCDIYRSKDAGLLLKDVMFLGASFNWRDAIRVATKGAAHTLDARPLMEYFQPLELWLRVQNQAKGTVGWTDPEDNGALELESKAGGAPNLTRLSALTHLSFALLVISVSKALV